MMRLNTQQIQRLGGMIIISLFFVKCTNNKPVVSVLGEMEVPLDNPMFPEKIELGRKLFFDTRLSSDGTVSCATCHDPSKAFTDQLPLSNGVDGKKSMRNAISLLNVGSMKTLMFDAHIESLEIQALVPIRDETEMNSSIPELINRLKAIPEYQNAARSIFKRDFDPWVLTRSLAAFQRSLVSDNAKFDQWKRGEVTLTAAELNGWKLFSEKLYCTQCHPPPFFTTRGAANNGLYADYTGMEDQGRFRIDIDSTQIGTFKIPSLRNNELTFPYMHDGSLKSIDDVIQHYEQGGKQHALQSTIIQPFKLNSRERMELKSFLKTLTDTTYLVDFQ